jgi:hypothetical protein
MAPGIVQFTPTLVTDKNGVCRTNWLSCTTPQSYQPATLTYGQLSTAVLNGYSPLTRNALPYTPYVSQGCASYNLNYLALLVLLVIPLVVGIFVGVCVPVAPCPGCAGNRPGGGFLPAHLAHQSADLQQKLRGQPECLGVSIQV